MNLRKLFWWADVSLIRIGFMADCYTKARKNFFSPTLTTKHTIFYENTRKLIKLNFVEISVSFILFFCTFVSLQICFLLIKINCIFSYCNYNYKNFVKNKIKEKVEKQGMYHSNGGVSRSGSIYGLTEAWIKTSGLSGKNYIFEHVNSISVKEIKF